MFVFKGGATMDELDYFVKETILVDTSTAIHIIDIQYIDNNLKALIDKYITNIWQGNRVIDIKIIKNQILKFLKPKTEDTQIGAVAEFFIHLYLNVLKYKQECLFKNLEEGSIKKGFDGYYSIGTEEWIAESKSGYSSTKGISHKDKIKEAYDDLTKKISGKTSNDPWANALNHADLGAVGASDNIKSNLQRLSIDFTNKTYCDVKNFNIIPCSTIFLCDNWNPESKKSTIDQIKRKLNDLKYKKIIVICINKKSLKLFMNYLKQ